MVHEWSEPAEIRELVSAKRSFSRDFLGPGLGVRAVRTGTRAGAENIVGTGVGEKFTSGRPTGELAIKVYVREKLREDRIESAIIPKAVRGFPTDVEAIGRLVPLMHIGRYRPVPGSVSTSLSRTHAAFDYAGTLGCLVQWGDVEMPHALSNNHVFADENRAPIGAEILQPGTLDGGVPHDQVATLAHFVKLQFGGGANQVDAALAKPDDGGSFTREVLGLGPLNGSKDPTRRMSVVKSGRTTQVTEGVVRDVDADIKVEYDSGVALFTDQIRITGLGRHRFSAAGDSGSIILEGGSNAAVGLLFAGSDTEDETFASKPSQLEQELQVTFPGAEGTTDVTQQRPRGKSPR